MSRLQKLLALSRERQLALVSHNDSKIFPHKCSCGLRFMQDWQLAQHVWRMQHLRPNSPGVSIWPWQDEKQIEAMAKLKHEKAA